jgi:hypothetical protein
MSLDMGVVGAVAGVVFAVGAVLPFLVSFLRAGLRKKR